MLQLARKVVILVISVGVLWATGSLFAQPATAACSINRFGECGGTCSGGTCKTQGSACVCVYSPPPCTVTSCNATCPTGCGQPAQTVYGTTNCNTFCSKYCSATAACCDNSCPTYCGFGGGRNDCGNWCPSTAACCSPVNGGWSAWSACVGGSQSRTCTNPSPSCGGSGCSGPSTQACTLPTCELRGSCTENCTKCRQSTDPADETKWTGNDQVTCYYYVPGTTPPVRWDGKNGNCVLPGSATSDSYCVYNTNCTTGLCHSSGQVVGYDEVDCGKLGAYDTCLNQVTDCVPCTDYYNSDTTCGPLYPGKNLCDKKSSLEYGTKCQGVGQTCTPQTSWGSGTSTSKCTGGPTPTPTPTPTPGPGGTPPPPPPPPPPSTTGWWQVRDGGASAKGNVRSDADANGGTLVDKTGVPAVVSCGGTTCSPAGDPKSWDVVSTISSAALADNSYAEFKRRVGNKVTPQAYSGLLTTGYWQVGASGTSLGGAVGDNVVVILSEGPVTITSNLTLGSQGILIVIAKGNITVNPAVNNIQGLFLTDVTFATGDSATPLVIDGSVAALTGVTLQRTTTGATPAELFVHHPEYLARIPAPVLNRNQFKSEEHP